MKVILKAFGILETEYEASIKNVGQPLYFVHRNSDFLITQMLKVPDISTIPDTVMKKAVFECDGKFENGMPVYNFVRLE